MKNLTTTLALLLVVAVVGGWIYFNERGPVARSGNTVLLRATPQSVSSLALQPASGARLEFARQNGDWQVHRVGTKSVAVPADEEQVEQLLESVQLLQTSAIVEADNSEKLKEIGLDKPQGTLIVNNAKIEFGAKPSFDTTRIYARVTDRSTPQIGLLPASLADFVSRSFNEWRDKSILRVKSAEAEQLKISTPGLKAGFERILKGEDGEEDQWLILSPVKGRADAGTIRALLEQLSLTQTPQFLEDDPKNLAQWELEKPVATVEVTTSEGVSTLRLGKVVPGGRVAQNSVSSVLFVVPDSLLAIISRPLRDWRDRQLLRFSTEDVQNVNISARAQQAEIIKDGATWKRKNGEDKSATATSQAAFDVLVGLQTLTAKDFNDKPQALSTYGLDKPALEVELFSGEWRAPKKIRLAQKNGKVYAQVSEVAGESYPATIYVLGADALKAFDLALNALFPARK